MSVWRQFTRGLRVLRNRKIADEDIADEIRQYLDDATAAHIAKGLSPDEAQRAARLELGGTTTVREQVRAYGWENAIDNFWADLRYAGRRLAGTPGFTLVSILTLALGIGASAAIFSVVNAVLLRELPYPNPQRIVRVWEQAPDGDRMNLADPNFDDFATQNNTFSALAVYGYDLTSVTGGSEPVRANVAAVSSGFFRVIGIEPFRGRAFVSEEQRAHGATAAIVSYNYWLRYLAGTPNLGQCQLRIQGAKYPVVGVMPEGFDFPPGVAIWIPRELDPEIPSRTAHNWGGLGRLREGVTIAQARANLGAIAHRIKAQFGKEVDLSDAAVVPLADAMVGNARTALLTLMGAVGLLLMIACANVSGLLLARISARRKELGICAALGAGRWRMTQQFLAESFVLSFAGGILGVLTAIWGIKLLPAILPANLPRQEGIAIKMPVLFFALGATIVVAFALGLLGAWRSAKGDVQEALTAGSRTYTATSATQRLRGFLVIGEVAMTVLILAGAGLLGRSFLRLISTNPGFSPQNLTTMEFSLPHPTGQAFGMDATAIARQAYLLEDILTRLRALPGAGMVGVVGAMPVAAGDDLADGTFLILNGQKPPTNFDEWDRIAHNRARTGYALYAVASEGYFQTMGIPLMRGRMFGEQDGLYAPNVAIISETLARQRWHNQDPIGQVIDFGNMDGILKPLTIVGIVGDIRGSGLDRPPSPIIYVDYRQRGMNANSSPTIMMRSAAPATQIVPAAREIFHELAPDAPVKFSTFADEMGGWLADRRFLLVLVGFFAAAALALAALGIYGVVAFSVTRRTQEIGVRMALGAQGSEVLRLVVGEGARLAIGGVLIGITASVAVTRLLSSLLFGVSATDPITFGTVAVLLCFVALAASYIPAQRAMRLDPNKALRYE